MMMKNPSFPIGENSVLTDIHFTKKPDTPQTLYDAISGNIKTEVFMVYMTDGKEVKRISKDTVDWKDIFARKDAHMAGMENLTGFPLIARQVDAWGWPDLHVTKSASDCPLLIFRDAKTNDPAMFMRVMYRDNDAMFVDDAFPLKCIILNIQGIKGYDAETFGKKNSCTPQECAMDMLIMGGKDLWKEGWQLELGPGASYASMGNGPVPWMKFLRDRYFSKTQMFIGSLQIMSQAKKRVREIFSLLRPESGA